MRAAVFKAFRSDVILACSVAFLPIQSEAQSGPPCSPHRATASAVISNGSLVGTTLTDGGCGYTNTPQVLVQGGGGSGATATAGVSNGIVASITITAAGSGYTNTPDLYIYSPLGLQVTVLNVSNVLQVSVSDLLVGTNYQLQSSTDLTNWTFEGPWFTATNTSLTFPQTWSVQNGSPLDFRVLPLSTPEAVTQVCLHNLMMINKALRDCNVEVNHDPTDPAMLSDIYSFLPYLPACPAGGTNMADRYEGLAYSYAVTDYQTKPTCCSLGGGSNNGHVLSPNVPNP